MRSKKTLSRPTAALLILVCCVLIFYMLRGDHGETAENAAEIRETYAGYAMTFPADAEYQTLSELLAATTYTEVTADQYVFKDYDTAAFVPYLPLAETITAVQSSPFNGEVVTYVIYSNAAGEEFCQCYKGDEMTNQTVYDPVTDCAYEITDRQVKVYDNFREEGMNTGTSLFANGLF